MAQSLHRRLRLLEADRARACVQDTWPSVRAWMLGIGRDPICSALLDGLAELAIKPEPNKKFETAMANCVIARDQVLQQRKGDEDLRR